MLTPSKVCMLSLCMHGFSLSIPAFSHSPITYISHFTTNLVCIWFDSVSSFNWWRRRDEACHVTTSRLTPICFLTLLSHSLLCRFGPERRARPAAKASASTSPWRHGCTHTHACTHIPSCTNHGYNSLVFSKIQGNFPPSYLYTYI